LGSIISRLSSGKGLWARVGASSAPLGQALACRIGPARFLHVVGETPLTGELRKLLEAGEAPGWALHPVPGTRTPLRLLAEPLLEVSGSVRICNLLSREGFVYAEELAVPDECLLGLPNSGPKLVTAVRQVLGDLGIASEPVVAPALAGPNREEGVRWRMMPGPSLSPDFIDALLTLADWAAAERGAGSLGDVIQLACDPADVPVDVAACWDCVRQHPLRPPAGTTLGKDLEQLAQELLDEVDEQRRLILLSRTFASKPCTYDSLVAQLGVSRERVRQLEESARLMLALAAVAARYAPLRWRATTLARAGSATPVGLPDAPAWMRVMLTSLASIASG
jgi:hypothetical protein